MRANNVTTWIIRGLGCALLFSLVSAYPAQAQDIDTHLVYVKMDYWQSAGSQTAEAWHFDDDNNGQWTQLPNDPNPPAGDRAQFTIEDLLEDARLEENLVWFLAVESNRVVAGEPGSFQNLSLNQEYSEMIDMMVFSVDGGPSNITPHDPCGERIWPIATGSEMTPYHLDPHPANSDPIPKHYAMLFYRDEILTAAAWRWKNPGNVDPNENVYIEFTLKFDFDKEPSNYLYTSCGVSWISAGTSCAYTFCTTQTTGTQVGSPFDMGPNNAPIILAVPHTLDHATTVRLYRRRNGQNTLLVERSPTNSNNYYTAHKCDPDGYPINWHVHTSGSAGHLTVGGFEEWQGTENLELNDEVFTTVSFNISPHSSASPTNHRGVYMIFWQRLIMP